MKLGLRGLVLALYFMVSGGPFGLEELLAKVGFWGAVPFLLLTPLVWSLPTALMVGELSSALPHSGGYYAWVRRGLGPFWGVQEAWLSFSASLFDMAIYPALFTSYLARLWPSAAAHPLSIGVVFIAVCLAWNLRGLEAFERYGTLLAVVLLAPFILLAACNWGGFGGPHAAFLVAPVAVATPRSTDLLGALLIAMWNFMGWDNASTLAGEVQSPQRSYPRGVALALVLVICTYMVPVIAAANSGVDPAEWRTGAWVSHARATGGTWVATAICIAGMVSPVGMFASLMASYARLPVALAEDGYLPRGLTRRTRSGAPWIALGVCAMLWTVTLGLSFERLVVIDILLYGLSLLLEFVTLVALRIREPELPRPYRVPGGLIGAVLLGLGPLLLVVLALVRNRAETVFAMPAVVFAAMVIALGPMFYLLAERYRRRG
jgi:amino acid transporter